MGADDTAQTGAAQIAVPQLLAVHKEPVGGCLTVPGKLLGLGQLLVKGFVVDGYAVQKFLLPEDDSQRTGLKTVVKGGGAISAVESTMILTLIILSPLVEYKKPVVESLFKEENPQRELSLTGVSG